MWRGRKTEDLLPIKVLRVGLCGKVLGEEGTGTKHLASLLCADAELFKRILPSVCPGCTRILKSVC